MAGFSASLAISPSVGMGVGVMVMVETSEVSWHIFVKEHFLSKHAFLSDAISCVFKILFRLKIQRGDLIKMLASSSGLQF